MISLCRVLQSLGVADVHDFAFFFVELHGPAHCTSFSMSDWRMLVSCVLRMMPISLLSSANSLHIWFKNTEWNLNEDDGQTGCAQFLVRNFLYTKVTNQQELDCVEHTLEVESCKLKDLSEVVPNVNNNNKQKDKANKILENFVLAPLFDESFNVLTDDDEHHQDFDDETTSVFDDLLPKSEPNADTISDRKSLDNDLMSSAINNNSTMIRVYCKERPPIGIPVFEHIELNGKKYSDYALIFF